MTALPRNILANTPPVDLGAEISSLPQNCTSDSFWETGRDLCSGHAVHRRVMADHGSRSRHLKHLADPWVIDRLLAARAMMDSLVSFQLIVVCL